MQWAIRDERVKQTRSLQKVDQERQLSQRRQRRLGIPLNPDRARETVEVYARRRAPSLQPEIVHPTGERIKVGDRASCL